MAAVAQQPNNSQFTTIVSSNGDSVHFSGTRVAASKVKSRQGSLSAGDSVLQSSQLSKQVSASGNPSAVVQVNSFGPPHPHTTSQVSPEETLVSVSSEKRPSPGPASSSSSTSADQMSSPLNHTGTAKHNECTTPIKQSNHDNASSSSSTSSLHRENSLDYKDSSGVDLHEFMVKTLRENPRDRLMLLKLERDFTEFIQDASRVYQRYPPMTSYHRMLVHRVAAYFGLDHNIDSSGKSVIVNKTPSTRIPDVRFQSYCSREYSDEEIQSDVPKSILLRSNTASSEENVSSPRESPKEDRFNHLEGKRSKSFEEREEDYIKAKERIFNKDASLELSELSSNASVSPMSTPDGSVRQRTQLHSSAAPGSDSQSEREAAIAAVAAATGRKSANFTGANSPSKRPDKFVKSVHGAHPYPFGGYTWPSDVDPYIAYQNSVPREPYYGSPYHPMLPGLHHVVGSSIQGMSPVDGLVASPQGSTVVLTNPAAGQPMLAPDGSAIFFQPQSYQNVQGQGSYSQVAPTIFPQQLQQQQQQHQQQPPQQQQQQQHRPQGPYGAVYYMSPAPGPPSQHYYVVQALPPSHAALYQQGQTGGDVLSPSSSLPIVASRPVTYQDLGNQMTSLTLQQRRVSADEGATAREKVQAVTPPTPTETLPPTQVFYHQGRQCFLVPQARILPSPGNAQGQGGIAVQLISGQPYGVSQYQQYVSAEPGPNFASALHSPTRVPTPVARQPALQAALSPAVSHYVTHSQSSLGGVPIAEDPSSSGQQAPRFAQGILPINRSVPVYIPVGHVQDVRKSRDAATTNGAAPNFPTHSVYRPGDKYAVKTPESPGSAFQYRVHSQDASAQGARSLVAVPPQDRPLLRMVPFNGSYSYVPSRLMSNQVYGQPHYTPRGMQSSQRKPRPRHPSDQIRISRRNSTGSESEQKTVSHILEVYEFPDTVTSNDDAVFDEIKTNGARILKISSSSASQQAVGGGISAPASASLGPTILAIFKSADDAQRALETISSPYYKLRVSQKSQTHFSGDNQPAFGKTF